MHLPATGSRLSKLVETTASQYVVSAGVAHKVRQQVLNTKRVKCFIEHMLHIVLVVRTHNLCAGPNSKTLYKHTYMHTYIH